MKKAVKAARHKAFNKTDGIKLASALLSLAMLVLSCVFLVGAPKIVLISVFIIFAAFGVAIPAIDAKKHETLFKVFFVALITAALILTVYIILQASGVLERLENIEGMIAAIRATGPLGIFVFVLFIIVNVVFLPIPPAIPAVIGTMLYGALWSFIFMTIGTVIGSVITFSLGRVFGKKIVVWMIGKEKTEKWANFINKKGRLAFLFMIILPFFPDDVLCLIAGMSHMSYGYFIGVICVARTAVLAFMCFFADGSIIPFRGWGIWVWAILGVLLIGAFILVTILKKRILRKKGINNLSK
ncbi:MAG: VTT domain-containing protein [Firmicutes bacterium]|nr:VTT domain-containing protein [Bacillota bacterium]